MKKMFNFDEIKHKRPAPGRKNSSSYRIFGEEVAEAENSPFQRAPLRPAPFYTEPNGNSMPAQEVEPWNRPYASRPGDIQPTNIGRANGRSGSMRAGHLEREDSRWWDWSGNKATEPRSITQAADDRMIKRGNSFQNVFHEADETTANPHQNGRYSANPKHTRAVGIVPNATLKSAEHEPMGHRATETAPYEQHYVTQTQLDFARREPNGPMQPSAKPNEHRRAIPSAQVERAGTMWDLFHPHTDTNGQAPAPARRNARPPSANDRNGRSMGAWANGAPYASDDYLDDELGPPPVVNQVRFD